MAESPNSDFTQILLDLHAEMISSHEATAQVFELVYDELRSIAGGLMRRERAGHTLQATAVVHEAYLRLVDETRIDWQSRAHFFGIAARAMRQILVQHARRRQRAKRGGGWERVTLDDQIQGRVVSDHELLRLDAALKRLAGFDERAARIVELRAFAGMTTEETARILDVSERTVRNDWRVANMWLSYQMTQDRSLDT